MMAAMLFRILIIGIAIAFASCVHAADADLFISPAGNDAWSGKLAQPNADKTDGPLASLDGARLKVREIRKQNATRKTPVVVDIQSGTYFLKQPVVFTADDSGTDESPTVFQSISSSRASPRRIRTPAG